MSDRIEPIGPHPATANRIPTLRRSDGSPEQRDRDGAPPRRRRPPPDAAPPPPDDGRPHVDVRV